jgi:hypothetical protein
MVSLKTKVSYLTFVFLKTNLNPSLVLLQTNINSPLVFPKTPNNCTLVFLKTNINRPLVFLKTNLFPFSELTSCSPILPTTPTPNQPTPLLGACVVGKVNRRIAAGKNTLLRFYVTRSSSMLSSHLIGGRPTLLVPYNVTNVNILQGDIR